MKRLSYDRIPKFCNLAFVDISTCTYELSYQLDHDSWRNTAHLRATFNSSMCCCQCICGSYSNRRNFDACAKLLTLGKSKGKPKSCLRCCRSDGLIQFPGPGAMRLRAQDSTFNTSGGGSSRCHKKLSTEQQNVLYTRLFKAMPRCTVLFFLGKDPISN